MVLMSCGPLQDSNNKGEMKNELERGLHTNDLLSHVLWQFLLTMSRDGGGCSSTFVILCYNFMFSHYIQFSQIRVVANLMITCCSVH